MIARFVVAFALVLVMASNARAAGRKVTFPFRDADYLWAGESNGGSAFVPESIVAGDRVPLVVFFHGVNVERVLHFWTGGRGVAGPHGAGGPLRDERRIHPVRLRRPPARREAR